MNVTTEQELDNFISNLVFSLSGSSSPSTAHPGVKRMLSDLGHEYINTLCHSAVVASTTESSNVPPSPVSSSPGNHSAPGRRASDGGKPPPPPQDSAKRRKVVKVRDFLLPISADGECYGRAKEILGAHGELEGLLAGANGVLELLDKEEKDGWEDGDTKGEGSVNLLEAFVPKKVEEVKKRPTRQNASFEVWTKGEKYLGEGKGEGEGGGEDV
ncbi:hypothetical protein TrRE_jg4133 [Triparma retinervis]|uniref:Uncharacterized protein n=1 Tax=Triparma retinervis TaxID=2557542 RepID=A0A9W7A7J6_9STRA|nr:hypothetical protein TrRE_jg4133 [Triparma retinervis]